MASWVSSSRYGRALRAVLILQPTLPYGPLKVPGCMAEKCFMQSESAVATPLPGVPGRVRSADGTSHYRRVRRLDSSLCDAEAKPREIAPTEAIRLRPSSIDHVILQSTVYNLYTNHQVVGLLSDEDDDACLMLSST